MLVLVGWGAWTVWRGRPSAADRFVFGAIAGWTAVLALSHSEPRYFIPLHPLLALLAARAVAVQPAQARGRILLLAIALTAISLAAQIISGDPVR
jgi:hypothetical protein